MIESEHTDLIEIKTQIDQVSGVLLNSEQYNNPLVWRQKMLEISSHTSKKIKITGLDLPPNLGGSGFSHSEMAEVFAYVGEKDLDLRDVPGVGHARIIHHASTLSDHQKSLLYSVINGESFFAVAITEENAGSDLRALKTTAIRTKNGYKINGHKMYVARLNNATDVIVFAKTHPKQPESLTAFSVPIKSKGITVENKKAMGLQGISFGGAIFDNTYVPLHSRIGDEGEGLSLFGKHFTYWRLAMASAAIGCSRKAIKDAVKWLKNREAFGKPIGHFTHLQQDLSKHITHMEMAWLLTLSAMDKIDRNQPSFVAACAAKAEAVEIALAATDWSMRIHGARGYVEDEGLGLAKRFRDLNGLRVADGATDVLRGQVARAELGEELYEMSLCRSKRPKNPNHS